MGLTLSLKSTNTFSHHNGVKMVVYGKAGAGKTRLCATCPTPVIFSAESGLMSLREYNLPFYEIKTVADIKECYNWARSSAEARAFETVCLDSISEIGEVSLAAALLGKKDPRQAYGEYNTDMYKILKDFRDLPGKHVYMSAKQDRFKTADGLMINGPSMPGQRMGQQLPYLPDLIFQLDTDPVQGWPFLRTKADFANDAKDRSGCLLPMERPDLGYVIARIKGMPAQQ
jgi:hypothetical protein